MGSGAFLVVSVLLGPVVAVTGSVWSIVFVLDLLSVGVAYFTIAFFVAASVRLYQDLTAMRKAQSITTNHAVAGDHAASRSLRSLLGFFGQPRDRSHHHVQRRQRGRRDAVQLREQTRRIGEFARPRVLQMIEIAASAPV